MKRLGFEALLEPEVQSPFITAFLHPNSTWFEFNLCYRALSDRGFIIYPGKLTRADTFRSGTIGRIFPADIEALLNALELSLREIQQRKGMVPSVLK